MSKIGKLPIVVKETVTVTITGQAVKAVGSKGESLWTVPSGILVTLQDGHLVVSQQKVNDPTTKALFGLTRASLANMIKGVESGFEKKLELQGVGYRAQVQGETLVLSLGFYHQVRINPKTGIVFSVADNVITVAGRDKVLVGEMAAEIRKIKKPEPYKGKGIRYQGEHVRRKAGKAAKAVGGK